MKNTGNRLPFEQEDLEPNVFRRTFDDSSSSEFIWHVDKYNRRVEVEHSDGGWYFQNDNEMPFLIDTVAQTFYVEREVYHRLLAGEGKLILKITNLVE